MRSFESQTPKNEKGTTTSGKSRVYKSKPTPPAAQAAVAVKESRFTQKQVRLAILSGALILALIISLVLVTLLPGCKQTPPASSSGISSSSSMAVSISEAPYDKEALAIPVDKYADTILPESEDAGDEYVQETLFLGDSNTERMLHFREVTDVTMSNGIGIASMGIGSVLGLRCVRFSGMADMTMPQAVAVMQPRRVVITFGTNNVGMYVDSFIDQYKTAAKAIKDAYPSADIIIGSVFPISQGCSYGIISQKGVDEFNLALVELAKEEGYKFLNWSEAITDSKTGYAKAGAMVGDGVHVSKSGMEEVFKYFRTHSYITEDTRPKPLKAIPNRLPTPEGLFPKPVKSSSDSDSDISKSSKSSSSASASSKSSQAPSSSEVPSSEAPPPATTYTITVSAQEGGSASGGGSGAAGAKVSLNVTAAWDDAVYEFTGWSVSGAASHEASGSTLVSVTLGSENVTAVATFKKRVTDSAPEDPSVIGGGESV